MARRIALALGACSVLLAAAPLSAQHAQDRQGFYGSFGIGGGSAGVSCDDCGDIDRESSTSMYVNFGGAVRPNLLVGGEINGWTKSEDGGDFRIASIMAVAHFYPSVTNGFFLSGGLGFTQGEIDDGVNELKSGGVGIQFGGGYDWRVARNFSLTPYAQYVRSFGAEAKLDGTGLGENLNPNFFQVGLGFTWH
jgi:hypothetical protein